MRVLVGVLLLLITAVGPAAAADRLDATPRIAVISAYEPEWRVLKSSVAEAKSHHANGVEFVTGKLSGRNVVLFLSGIGMVNAAMTSQLAFARFDLSGVVFSGIAGGVDPGLRIGDVVVAGKWGQYLEAVFAREVDGRFQPPPWAQTPFANFGMMFPIDVWVRSTRGGTEKRFWFEADAGMLAAAGRIGAVALKRCTAARDCLSHEQRLVIGGNGVSGAAFVDNAAFRQYVFTTFEARVLDMESAAVATVAYANAAPFIAFRSLSDLAGGGAGVNEMHTFLQVASDNSAAVVQRFLESWTPPR
ncbi:MAG: 5'-methylthioadenosine/S-adenosylhomocysteine nucleosidase [Alphaproteobacteria bacterium]|nr:5'-methylthioadenosine/S-adenosylhomocysteine nucleosidase [Alphaproteobacteria bacterium]